MSDPAQDATCDWYIEVSIEEARLIREGMPPWEATEEAVRIVSTRRQAAAKDGRRKAVRR